MKAITILQPWAGFIPAGAKTIETRSWSTQYRGPIAIHAAKDQDKKGERIRHIVARAEQYGILVPEIHFGAIIAIAKLTECFKVVGKVSLKIENEKRVAAVLENGMKVTGIELELGDYTIGRYAWILSNMQAIKPIPARGQQRFWNWSACPRYIEWPIGTKVKMVNCLEADGREDVVWTTRSNPWLLGHGEQVVLLENYSGGFATECLEVVV